MPPRHDLRGGQASADSFTISKSIFVPSMSRCFFAMQIRERANSMIVHVGPVHELCLIWAPLAVGSNLLRNLGIFESGLKDENARFAVVVRKVEVYTPRGPA